MWLALCLCGILLMAGCEEYMGGMPKNVFFEKEGGSVILLGEFGLAVNPDEEGVDENDGIYFEEKLDWLRIRDYQTCGKIILIAERNPTGRTRKLDLSLPYGSFSGNVRVVQYH